MSALADSLTFTPRRRASRPRRIALFTGAYNHIADGVSLTLNRLVAHLERTGAEVRVFAPTVDDPPVEHAGTLVPVPSVAAPGRSDYRVATHLPRSVRKKIERFDPTLFHIATPDLVGRQALSLAKSSDVPAVASYHTHFSSYLKYYRLHLLEGLLWTYLRRFYQRCRHVYVPSPSMAEVLRSHGITQGLRLWKRGVDTTRFHPEKRSLAWRRHHGIADDEVVVSFVGRLVWEKGLDVYADVIETLRERGVAHRSLVVGDGPARAELAERLPNAIFTGHLEDDALPRAYASSDVFLFPSDTETFGNVTLEAMACGLPAVCADATGSTSLVRDGETGFLAPAGDVEGFAGYVQRLGREPELRRAMSRRATERAQNFEWETVLERLVGYYDEILDPAPAPGGDGAASEAVFSAPSPAAAS
jgi:glycosyltransferase involved in cell wall biosynthesis